MPDRFRTSLPININSPRPERISLYQAYLVLCGGWTPIHEDVFRPIESLPVPSNIEATRLLILALAHGHVRHQGQLWRMRAAIRAGSGGAGSSYLEIPGLLTSEHPIECLAKTYSIEAVHWMADKVALGSSELYLTTCPSQFARNVDGEADRSPYDFYKLREIVVLLTDVEKLSLGSIEPKKVGGRPPKIAALLKIAVHVSAHISRVGPVDNEAELVAILLEYSDGLPKKLRLAETKIREIAQEHFKQCDQFDNEPGITLRRSVK
jgi:hypothetical protein